MPIVDASIQNGDVNACAIKAEVLRGVGRKGVAGPRLDGAVAHVIHYVAGYLPFNHGHVREHGHLCQVFKPDCIQHHKRDQLPDIPDSSELGKLIANLSRSQTMVQINHYVDNFAGVKARFNFVVNEITVPVAAPRQVLLLADHRCQRMLLHALLPLRGSVFASHGWRNQKQQLRDYK